MIVDLRVDDRLIHGQVALIWTKKLGATGIVVANDKASQDPVQQMTLKMAVPNSVKFLVKSVQDAVDLFRNPKAADMKIFVIVNKVADALELVRNVEGICRVNIANAGRFDGIPESEKKKLANTIILSDDEMSCLKELVESKVPVVTQVVPDHPERDMKSLL